MVQEQVRQIKLHWEPLRVVQILMFVVVVVVVVLVDQTLRVPPLAVQMHSALQTLEQVPLDQTLWVPLPADRMY